MHQIRLVTLDLDDTLWEIAPVIRRAEAMLWQWLESNYPRIIKRWTAPELLQLRNDIAAQFPQHAHDFRFLRKQVLRHIAVDSDYSEDLVEPAFAVFDQARNTVELFPEVQAELRFLAAHFSVIAITNGNANLQAIGIDGYFSEIVSAVSVGVAKPARPIFDEAMRLGGFEPHETLHVGDHPETDVDGARNAGMRTAWMNRTEAVWPAHIAAPDVTVTSVSELRELLEPAVRARRG